VIGRYFVDTVKNTDDQSQIVIVVSSFLVAIYVKSHFADQSWLSPFRECHSPSLKRFIGEISGLYPHAGMGYHGIGCSCGGNIWIYWCEVKGIA
jgi:hypothetical protein